MLNKTRTITAEESIKLYANLKFEEKGLTTIKPGTTVTLEETGKVYEDREGKSYEVLRLRKNTRNYYVLMEL